MASKHILIAEDELNMRLSLSLTLKKAGYSVSHAKDGYEALKMIGNSKNGTPAIDLLLTEIQMPGLTGVELVVELDRLNISLPVLIITGYGETVIGLKDRGYTEFIEKPLHVEDLLDRVAHLLMDAQ